MMERLSRRTAQPHMQYCRLQLLQYLRIIRLSSIDGYLIQVRTLMQQTLDRSDGERQLRLNKESVCMQEDSCCRLKSRVRQSSRWTRYQEDSRLSSPTLPTFQVSLQMSLACHAAGALTYTSTLERIVSTSVFPLILCATLSIRTVTS